MTGRPEPEKPRHGGAPACQPARAAAWWTTATHRAAGDAWPPATVVLAPRMAMADGDCAAPVPQTRAGAPVADPRGAWQQARAAGLVVHRATALNAETPLRVLAAGAAVPNDRFYIRNHFGIPALNAATWRLEVGGLAGRPLSLSLAELRSMPSRTVEVMLECAGNGRSGLNPATPGEQWGLGAAGLAAWTGVPLTEILAAAAPQPGAREVVFRGADRGRVEGRGGPVPFERSLPVGRLGPAAALLAYAMNGQPLPAAHGYPLRLIVPGWYGVASVKWLTRIELTGRAFDGHFQADRYHIGGEPLTLQAVRSLITQPAAGDLAEPGDVVVRGLAWSGAAPITRVEVSLGGQPWQQATLADPGHPHGWCSWELPTRLAERGSITVRARATDAAGRTQPSQPAWNPLGYANNAVHHVQISVGPRRRSPMDAGTLTTARVESQPAS